MRSKAEYFDSLRRMMEDIALMKNYDLEFRKSLAKYLAGIEPGPAFREMYPRLAEWASAAPEL